MANPHLEKPLALNLERLLSKWQIPFFRRYDRVLEFLGYSMSPIYRDLGIDEGRFDELNSGIGGQKLLDLMSEVAHRHRDPSVGVKIGELRDPKTLGYRFYIALFSDSLRQALADFCFSTSVYIPFIDFRLVADDQYASLRFAYRIQSANLGYQADSDLLMLIRLIRALLQDETWRPSYISLSYKQDPKTRERMETFSGCPVVSQESATAIVFPSALLDVKLSLADQHMKSVVSGLHQSELEKASLSLSWEERVTVYLVHHYNTYREVANQHQLAVAYGLSKSSLHRQLVGAGVSYRELRNKFITDLACYYLCDTGLKIETIAERLGYQNVSAFHRMFKQSMNMSPASFRRQES